MQHTVAYIQNRRHETYTVAYTQNRRHATYSSLYIQNRRSGISRQTLIITHYSTYYSMMTQKCSICNNDQSIQKKILDQSGNKNNSLSSCRKRASIFEQVLLNKIATRTLTNFFSSPYL